MTMGHNGGPKLTAKVKLELIQATLRRKLNQTEKLIALAMIAEADIGGKVKLSTKDLQQIASVKRRETVFAATKKLEHDTIEKNHRLGQSGTYQVIPEAIMRQIEEAYEAVRSKRTSPVRSKRTSSGTVQPYQSGTVQADQSGSSVPLSPAPARVLDNKTNKYNNLTTTTVEPRTRESGGGSVPGFESLNGTSFDLVAFIQRFANVPEDVARNMLKNNIQAFTEPAMVEAFSITQCDMATKTIAAPYKYLIACARKSKTNKGRSSGDSMRRLLKEKGN